jgi:hypothetical protein
LGASSTAPCRFLARQKLIPRAQDAMGACAIAGEFLYLPSPERESG